MAIMIGYTIIFIPRNGRLSVSCQYSNIAMCGIDITLGLIKSQRFLFYILYTITFI